MEFYDDDGAQRSAGQLLLQVSRLVGERLRVRLDAVGLHPAQGPALFFLGHHEGVTQGEVARRLRLTAASVSAMLQRMERDGWVERRADPADQRLSRVYLTAKARGLRAEAEDCFRGLEEEIGTCLEPADVETLARLLRVVRARLLRASDCRCSTLRNVGTEGEDAA
ncbi:MAG: MarR family winged helix-turn-helix transcriptional regulator [Candidatus Bipolaricaulota bacterium]